MDTFFELYPFEPNYHTVSGGHRMHYVDTGEGQPCVMVHGNPTWSFYYRNVIKALSGSHRCIAPDHIGCGLSDKPQDYTYSLRNHIANIISLIDSLELESFDLIVHDWGGPIGFALAQHFKDKVKRIVILNTSAFLSRRIPKRIAACKVPFLGDVLVRGLNAFARGATWMASVSKLPKAVRQGYLMPYNNWKNRIATLRFVQDIPLSAGHPSYETMQAVEAGMEALKEKPMLVLWGAQDFCFTQHFYACFQHLFPKASFHYLEEAGHYVLEDAGDKVVTHLREFFKDPVCAR